jgi:hypothetical protein
MRELEPLIICNHHIRLRLTLDRPRRTPNVGDSIHDLPPGKSLEDGMMTVTVG